MSSIQDDAVGYLACLVAVVFFGSNFVPVKRVATADGFFFSLIMTSAVLLEGCLVQLWRGNPKFEPFAMLGGVIWCAAAPPPLLRAALSRRTGRVRTCNIFRAVCVFFSSRRVLVLSSRASSRRLLTASRPFTPPRIHKRATGNMTVVPIVKSIGLGLGLLIWGLVGMLVGWASGHFGILGVAPDPPLAAPWANYAGVIFAAASLGVYANITSEVANGGGGSPRNDDHKDRGVPGASGSSERDVDWLGNSPRSPAAALGMESPRANPFASSEHPFAARRSEREALLAEERAVRGGGSPGSPGSPPLTRGDGDDDADGSPGSTPRWMRRAAETPRSRFAFGFALAVGAGVFYGTNFTPPQHLIDAANAGDVSHSTDGLDYVFSHFCGIFLATLVYFVGYCVAKQAHGRKPQLPPCVLPAFCSGLMWGIAQICWFVANERLSFSVSFPIITSVPGLVGALWGVLVFGEIKGRDNYVLLVWSGVMRLVAVALIAASKEGF